MNQLILVLGCLLPSCSLEGRHILGQTYIERGVMITECLRCPYVRAACFVHDLRGFRDDSWGFLLCTRPWCSHSELYRVHSRREL